MRGTRTTIDIQKGMGKTHSQSSTQKPTQVRDVQHGKNSLCEKIGV